MFVLGVGGGGGYVWVVCVGVVGVVHVCVVKDKVKMEKSDYVIVHQLYFFFFLH